MVAKKKAKSTKKKKPAKRTSKKRKGPAVAVPEAEGRFVREPRPELEMPVRISTREPIRPENVRPAPTVVKEVRRSPRR
jgi:hypothetical protein